MDLRHESLVDLAAGVTTGERTAIELVEHSLGRIDALDGDLNAWVVVDAERARAEARAIDARVAAGETVGPLAGIPIGVKDLEDAAGFTTGFGSQLHAEDAPAAADSPLVARLRAAGCVVLGKTATPEFGFKGDTTSLAQGVTRNPWNLERSPGGSSGGSAAALASGMVALATGSDGGGSIRIPSALCGLSGLKTSQGRVPMGGPKAPGTGGLSVRGPMTRRVRDLVHALDVCVGPDPSDPFSLPPPQSPWAGALEALGAPARVLWAPSWGWEVDAEIARVCATAVARLADAGTEVVHVDEVFAADPLSDWFTLWAVYSDRTQGHLRDTPDWERIDPELRSQIDYGHEQTAVAFVQAADSVHQRNLDLVALFGQAPILLCPTVAGRTAAAGRSQGTVNGTETPFWAPFTGAFNLTRNPAGSVCAGFTDDGMPVGLQVVGPQHADVAVLRAMTVLEDLLADQVAPIG
jgi:aspartyl-tRNA(Asn)/glutamyl-tRNA(Gln) amidotransferase subunit A